MPRLNHQTRAAAEKPPSATPLTKVLIAEGRAMAADTMAHAVNRARGLVLSSRCSSRSEVVEACAVATPDVAALDLGLYE